jgi:hypothetical protein
VYQVSEVLRTYSRCLIGLGQFYIRTPLVLLYQKEIYMPIERIYSFLTYPKNHERAADEIEGVRIRPDGGKLSKMLSEVFDGAKTKRDVPVSFVTDNQVNPTRVNLLSFFERPNLASALAMAQALQAATPGTAGMGLFFVCLGSDEGKPGRRVVLSRFAADEGVVVEFR